MGRPARDEGHGLLATLALSAVLHGAIGVAFVGSGRAKAGSAPDPAPAFAGETFELPAPETVDVPLANASPSPDDVAAPAPPEQPDAPARPSPPRAGARSGRPSHAGRPSGGRTESGDGDPGGTSSRGLTYGAVGDRSATDLLTAITHGFAQGASGDPSWRSAPIGAAGEATLVLTLDGSGRLIGSDVLGSPSPALRSGIRRTLALVRARPFVARGKVTRLHLVATVSRDSVHDDEGSDVFAIGRSVAGGEGHGWFALSIGRRIDLHVRPR